jgi:hypothetical protein
MKIDTLILTILFGAVIAFGIWAVADTLMDRKEVKECTEWQKATPPYTWADWQIKQCEYQKLPLPKN